MKEKSSVQIKVKSQEELCKEFGEFSLSVHVRGGILDRSNWL